MNRLVVLAACMCSASASVLLPAARAFAAAPVQQSHQFHAQDEFGQFTFGHAGGPSARTESRNAYGVTTGSYQYVDANGILQTTHYTADPINGFRVTGTNLPVAAAAPVAAPLAAPVFSLVGPAPVQDTPEVVAAKAEFQAAYDEAVAATAVSRKRRQAVISPLAYGAGILNAGILNAGTPAGILSAGLTPYNALSAPAGRDAILTTIKLNPGHATFYRVD